MAGKSGAGGNTSKTSIPGLKKAVLKVYKASGELDIPCMFNPAQYRISENAGYADKKEVGTSSSLPQYVGGASASLSLSLYYDTTDNLGQIDESEKGKSVMSYVKQMDALIAVDGDLHKPPEVGFIWGDISFRGVVTSLSKEFTYFGQDGKPLRVKMDLTISSVPKESAARKDPNNSPDRTKYRQVKEGTSLWKMAWDEYGDCERWKDIAEYNHLMDPLDIRPGQIIKLPAIKN